MSVGRSTRSHGARPTRLGASLGVVAAIAVVAIAGVAGAVPTQLVIDNAAEVSQQAERGDTQTQHGASSTARYRVTIVQEWSAGTHPTTLPSGWHTSPAVLAAHLRPGDMFAAGNLASSGIERMAEVGSTSTLLAELAANPTVGDVNTGAGIDRAGSDTLDVEVNQGDGHLSLVTMLAPSPDWFVGFSSVAVFLGDRWADRIMLDLQPYDAGTDSGARFVSANADTQPPQAISGPRDSQFVAAVGEGRFGYAVIERIG